MSNPGDWTPEDVAAQVRQLGLGKYARKFIDAGITGPQFCAMNDAKLRELGLPVQPRVTLTNFIKCLPAPQKRAGGGGAARKPAGGAVKPAGGGLGSGRAAAAPPRGVGMPKQTAASRGRAAARAAEPRDPEPEASVPKKPPVRRPAGLGRGPRQPDIPMEEDAGPDDRVECSYCGRKFASDRIAKHEDVCRTASKKRKVFNSKRQRLSGTEAAQFQRASREPAKPAKQMINGKPKYVVEHENLVASLKAARRYAAYADAAAAGKAKGPPPPMPQLQEVPDDRIQCKYCGRKFGAEQYERHVRHCAASQPIPSVRGRGRGAARGAPRAGRGGRRF